MKYLLILALTFLQFANGYSQRSGGGGGRGGGGQRGGQSQQQQQTKQEERVMEVINLDEVAGLIKYDAEVVIKESKVKEDEETALMTQFITEYNHKIDQIKKDNKVKLETIDITTRVKQQEAIDSKDHKQLMEIGKKIRTELNPVKLQTMDAEKELNAKIESAFSEKINKKWLAYFKKQKEEREPKQPKEDTANTDSNSSRPGRPNGQ